MGELIKLEEVQNLSKVFVESKLFKDVADVAKASVKIIAGASLGLEAFQSMQGIDIIQGKLVINAATQASMVKKSGKYDYRIIEHTNEICKLEFLEKKDGKFEKIGDSSFNLDDARLAGLAAKDNWIKYPKNMLFARAFSNGVKWCCPDVFGGAVYNESDSFQQEPESKFKAEIVQDKPNHLSKHFELGLKDLKEIIDGALDKNDLFNMKRELTEGLKSLNPVEQTTLNDYFIHKMGKLPIGDLIGTFEVMQTTDLFHNIMEPGDWKEEKPSEIFLAFKKKIETEAFTLMSLKKIGEDIKASGNRLSINETEKLREIFAETYTKVKQIEQGEITL